MRSELDIARAEVDRLRKIIDCLPSRTQVAATEQRAADLAKEVEALKKELKRFEEDKASKGACKADHSSASIPAISPESPVFASVHPGGTEDDSGRGGDSNRRRPAEIDSDRRRAAEIELLRLQLSQSLSQPQVTGRQDEVDRLRQAMGEMVPRSQADEALAEVGRLRAAMTAMVPRAEADAARAEAARLQLVVDGMVPRSRVEAAMAEVDRLQVPKLARSRQVPTGTVRHCCLASPNHVDRQITHVYPVDMCDCTAPRLASTGLAESVFSCRPASQRHKRDVGAAVASWDGLLVCRLVS